MKIIMHSITPLFPNHDLGGAQKHLRYISQHLGECGHQVIILSTRRDDTKEPFQWHPNVTVKPILRYKQPFPGPYDTGAHNIASIIQDFSEHLQDADRCYIHDGELLFPFVYEHVPTVVSLRDNVYPETIQGAFIHQPHSMILISEYSRKFVLATAGRFFPELANRIQLIPNGIDWHHFKPSPTKNIQQLIPIDPSQHPIILHPHRPEETKGMQQTIGIVDQLVHQYKHHNLRVLVPKWLGTETDTGVTEFYKQMSTDIQERGLSEHFIFHDWIPYSLLNEYYSLGTLTLSQGSFVESFGNAVYESLGCGTPSVVARVATHRELLPESLIDKNDYNDLDTAAAICDEIIRSKRRTSAETIHYLHEHYSQQQQLLRYREVIEQATLTPKMKYTPKPITKDTFFALAPWCYRSASNGYYHDFKAAYRDLPELDELLTETPAGFVYKQALNNGLSANVVEEWYREGYIVPVPHFRG